MSAGKQTSLAKNSSEIYFSYLSYLGQTAPKVVSLLICMFQTEESRDREADSPLASSMVDFFQYCFLLPTAASY